MAKDFRDDPIHIIGVPGVPETSDQTLELVRQLKQAALSVPVVAPLHRELIPFSARGTIADFVWARWPEKAVEVDCITIKSRTWGPEKRSRMKIIDPIDFKKKHG